MNLKFESIGKIKDFPVSDIVGKFIVFKEDYNQELFNNINYLETDLTFGYVFPLKEEGLLVVKIATGFLDDNNLVKIHKMEEIPEYKLLPQEDDVLTVKVNDIKDCEFIFTDNLSSDLKDKYYSALPFQKDAKIEKLYKLKELDKFRDNKNPLVVNVGELQVKLENSGSYGFVGKVLNKDDSRVVLTLADDDLVIDDNFSNKKNSEIILEILSKLKSSCDFNRRYLKSKFDDFKDNPEVCKLILEKYEKQLEGDDREIFKARQTKYFDEITKKCESFIDLSKSGQSKQALELIKNYISNYSCSDDYILEFFEKDLFTHYFSGACFYARHDLSTLYKSLGVILNDNNQKSEALKAFKKAYYLNPVNVDNLVELAIYYLDYDLEKCKSTLDLGFKYAYTVESFHELYHVLEEYYYKISDFKRAEAVSKALCGDFESASKLDVPTDFNIEVLKLIMEKLEIHVANNNRQCSKYYLDLLIATRNCQIMEISEGFSNFLELEYLDF